MIKQYEILKGKNLHQFYKTGQVYSGSCAREALIQYLEEFYKGIEGLTRSQKINCVFGDSSEYTIETAKGTFKAVEVVTIKKNSCCGPSVIYV